jgi:hypothetical protein
MTRTQAAKLATKQRARETAIIIQDAIAINISPEIWLQLYESTHVKNNTLHSFKIHYGIKLSWEKYKGIGLIRAPKNTLLWKKSLIVFLLKQKMSYRHAVLNMVVNRHLGRVCTNTLHLHCNSDTYIPIFSLPGFNFYRTKEGHKTFTFNSGSFLIDNRWVHIGQ